MAYSNPLDALGWVVAREGLRIIAFDRSVWRIGLIWEIDHTGRPNLERPVETLIARGGRPVGCIVEGERNFDKALPRYVDAAINELEKFKVSALFSCTNGPTC